MRVFDVLQLFEVGAGIKIEAKEQDRIRTLRFSFFKIISLGSSKRFLSWPMASISTYSHRRAGEE